MSNNWVVNASPLILLAKVGQIELLSKLTEQLVIPASVLVEVQGGPATDPARVWLHGEGSKCVQPDVTPVPAVLAWDLGPGETAVLSWARQHRGFEVILDDCAARKCAAVEGIGVRGTIGVVLAAKVRGLIPAAKPICDSIVQAGLRVDTRLLRGALSLVGE